MSNTETMKQVYFLAQEHCGLKVGDWVKITRKAVDYECGWAFEWLSDADKTIGKIGKICDIRPVGIEVSFTDPNLANCWYPYFVLEKVEKAAHEFKPFDKVLVRNRENDPWEPDIFKFYGIKDGLLDDPNMPFYCMSDCWIMCIPYEGNEHLVGTMDKPEE